MPNLPKYAFFEGNIVPFNDAKVSVATHALHYGTGAFGGLRGYWNEEEATLFVFRPVDHFTRLLNSAKLLRMDLPYTPQDLVKILQELLHKEAYTEDVYIRPYIYKSTPTIGVRLHDLDEEFTMFSMPLGNYLPLDGLHATISSWRRIDDNAIPARGKISGAYANSAQIVSDAKAAGFDDAIVLNEDGHIAEAAAANFFMVRDGVVYTPPITANILEGITRRTVIQLLREDLGFEVVERNIDRTELFICDETFSCGTGYQVAPITKVDYRLIGDGKIGPITQQVQDTYFDVVRGKIAKYRDWLVPAFSPVATPAD